MENIKKEAAPELEQRVLELETTITTLTNKIAALEGQVQAQPKKHSDIEKIFDGVKSYPTNFFSDNQNHK